MLDRLFALLPEHPAAPPDTVGAPFDQRQLAVAVLLLELAQADRNVPAPEAAAIHAVLRERFGLDAARAASLLDTAHTVLGAALEDWVFASIVRASFGPEERVPVLRMLWEVVYADGKLATLERELMARVARELGIDEAASEAARIEALERIKARAGGSGVTTCAP